MKAMIIKQIAGILCLLSSLFLLLSTVYQAVTLVDSLTTTSQSNSSYTPAFMAGQVAVLLIFLLGSFFLYKLGRKWLQTKKN